MAGADGRRVPTIAVEDLHVVYRVWGTKQVRTTGKAGATQLFKRTPTGQMQEIHAIRGVSFTAFEGEAVGLIGRNGSGKSTLLQAIAGLLPPRSGNVYTNTRPALLGVNAALMNNLTGERNIVLGCLAMGMSPEEMEENYESVVEFSGIRDFIGFPMSAYSSGMAARLRFAIAASVTHDVLLIDEALATGDADFQRRSEARINELREQAGTVFLVSHGLGVVRDTCSRAIWLDEGRILMDGDVNEVVDAYEESVRTTKR